MEKDKVKQTEWDDQAASTKDFCRQVCRTVDQTEFDQVIDDIKSKLDIEGNLDAMLDVGCGNGVVLSQFRK